MMSKQYVEDVKEFHNAYKIDGRYEVDDVIELLEMRLKLMEEEYEETKRAIIELITYLKYGDANKIIINRMLCEILDGLVDQTVINIGTADLMDFDFHTAWQRVHDSNMSKLGEDGNPIYREDGKVLKGPNFKPPQLMDLIA